MQGKGVHAWQVILNNKMTCNGRLVGARTNLIKFKLCTTNCSHILIVCVLIFALFLTLQFEYV